MKALLLFVVLVICFLAVESVSPMNHRFTSARRRRVWSGAAGCAKADWEAVAGKQSDWNSAGAVGTTLADTNGIITVVNPTQTTLKWDATLWRYGAGNFDAKTGVTNANAKMNADAWKDGMTDIGAGPFTDLLKIYPHWVGTAFCAANNNLCCPDRATTLTACPPAVTGLPRKYMPQILKPFAVPGAVADVATGGAWETKLPATYGSTPVNNKFYAWANGIFSVTNFECTLKDVAINSLKPAQDEVSGFKTSQMYCTQIKVNPTFGAKIAPRPVVCNDGFIFDGHHRWSAYYFAAEHGLKDAAGTVLTPTSLIKVYECNQPCGGTNGLIAKLKGTWDYVTPATNKNKNDNGIEFAEFVELEARFGRSAHQSMEQAQAAYVEQTRARLADIGMEMKGGDEALEEMFHMNAGHLWK